MTTQPSNLAASIHQRLLNQSKTLEIDFNLLLTRFAIERFLYRLASSSFNEQFVLKGAMLLQIWLPETGRPTRDLDLLGYGNLTADRLGQIFSAICVQSGFAKHPSKVLQWNAFRKKSGLQPIEEDFVAVTGMIDQFLGPVVDAVRDQSPFPMTWLAGGPWMANPDK